MKPTRITFISSFIFVGAFFAGGVRAAEPIKLAGIFDPYECRDSSVTNAVVMKPMPKCGECHASAVLTLGGEVPQLKLTVAHGRTTNSWVFTGQPKDGQIIFEKPKFHLTYSDGCLKGEHKGKMNAHIELKAAK